MIQEIIALVIVSATILYVLWRFYKNLKDKKNTDTSFCAGCTAIDNCKIKDLKNNHDKKKEGCREDERL